MSDVIVRSQAGLTQSIAIGDYKLIADEPVDAGGTGLGPNPYELLLAALGACTSMTVGLGAGPLGRAALVFGRAGLLALAGAGRLAARCLRPLAAFTMNETSSLGCAWLRAL